MHLQDAFDRVIPDHDLEQSTGICLEHDQIAGSMGFEFEQHEDFQSKKNPGPVVG
jgi:hypothetical protein